MLITLIGHHVPSSEVVVLCGNTKRSPVYISFFWIIELDPRNHKPQESDEELRRTKSFYLPFPRVFMHWLCCCCFGSFTTPPPRSIIVHEIDHVMHFSSSIWDLSLKSTAVVGTYHYYYDYPLSREDLTSRIHFISISLPPPLSPLFTVVRSITRKNKRWKYLSWIILRRGHYNRIELALNISRGIKLYIVVQETYKKNSSAGVTSQFFAKAMDRSAARKRMI